MGRGHTPSTGDAARGPIVGPGAPDMPGKRKIGHWSPQGISRPHPSEVGLMTMVVY